MTQETITAIVAAVAVVAAAFSLGWFSACLYNRSTMAKENEQLHQKINSLEEKLAKKPQVQQRRKRKKNETGNSKGELPKADIR